MADDIVTTQVLKRRASDQESKQRIVTGWVGIGMAVLGFGAGLLMLIFERGSVMVAVGVLVGSFLAAMVAGNRLPFSEVAGLIPKWGPRS